MKYFIVLAFSFLFWTSGQAQVIVMQKIQETEYSDRVEFQFRVSTTEWNDLINISIDGNDMLFFLTQNGNLTHTFTFTVYRGAFFNKQVLLACYLEKLELYDGCVITVGGYVPDAYSN